MCRKKYACYVTQCDATDVFPNSFMIVNGVNTTVTSNSTTHTIQINANVPGADVTLAGVGGGQNLVVDGLGPDLAIRTLVSGNGISLSTVGNTIVVSANAAVTTLANTGAGAYGLVVDGLGPDLTIKTINAGTNINITDVSNVLTINAVDAPVTTLANIGAGSYGLVVDGLGPDLTIKTINAGTNITISDVSNVLTINAADAPTTTLANTGAGSYGLVVDGLGPDLTIKTINAGAGIIISDVSNVLTISANDIDVTTTLANTGAGVYGLVVNGTGPNLTVKTINAGNNVTISDNSNVLTINAADAPVTTLANTGAGSYGLVVNGTGPNLTVKTINAGNGITISDSANVLTVNANAVTLANTGAGLYGLVVTGTGFNHTIKTINAGNNISITDVSNVLTINAANAPTVTLANTGAGVYGLVVNGTGPSLTVKTINAGNNISITDVANVLTINANLSGIVSNVTYYTVSSNAAANTSSTTFVTITDMSLTPPSGTYYIQYSSSGEISTASAQTSLAIQIANVTVNYSTRYFGYQGLGGSRVPMGTQTIANVNGSQAITAVFARTSGIGTYTMYDRILSALKLN